MFLLGIQLIKVQVLAFLLLHFLDVRLRVVQQFFDLRPHPVLQQLRGNLAVWQGSADFSLLFL